MIPISLYSTIEDFDQIVHTGMRWGQYWESQPNRFEPVPPYDFEMAYWVSSYLEALVCQQILRGEGYKVFYAYDTATNDHLLLTNYKSPEWRNDD